MLCSKHFDNAHYEQQFNKIIASHISNKIKYQIFAFNFHYF